MDIILFGDIFTNIKDHLNLYDLHILSNVCHFYHSMFDIKQIIINRINKRLNYDLFCDLSIFKSVMNNCHFVVSGRYIRDCIKHDYNLADRIKIFGDKYLLSDKHTLDKILVGYTIDPLKTTNYVSRFCPMPTFTTILGMNVPMLKSCIDIHKIYYDSINELIHKCLTRFNCVFCVFNGKDMLYVNNFKELFYTQKH